MNTLLQKNTFKGRGSGRSILVVVALIFINLISAIGAKAQTGYADVPFYNQNNWGYPNYLFPDGWVPTGMARTLSDVGPAGSSPQSVVFDTGANTDYAGDNITIRFNETPGRITFYARSSGSFNGGKFVVEQSLDGNDYTKLPNLTIQDLVSSSGGNMYSFVPHITTKVIRFRYENQPSNDVNVWLDNVDIQQQPEINVFQGDVSFISGSQEGYNFGEVEERYPSSEVEFTIKNTGLGKLDLTKDISITGANPTEFQVVKSPSMSIAAGESTTFTVIFKPKDSYQTEKTAVLSIFNTDADETTFKINLRGTSTAAPLSISSFEPNWGPSKTRITINGVGFTEQEFALWFIDSEGKETSVDASSIIYYSSSKVSAIIPDGVANGNGNFRLVAGSVGRTSPTTFYVGNSAPTPLPVEFLNFSGASTSKGVQLQWQTASETNNEYFQLESATTFKAEAFKPVLQVASKVNNSAVITSYEALDTKPAAASTIYYRLKQVDFDGKFEYSKVIAVSNTAPLAAKFKVKPNPVVENKMVVELPDANGGDLALTFTSMAGARALQQTASVEANTLEKEISLDALAPGLYIVTIEYNDQVSHQRVLKQ